MFPRLYRSVEKPALRVPSVTSAHALYIAGKFASRLRGMVRDLNKVVLRKGEPFPFDAVAFEAAAYAHYNLMRERLLADAKPDNEAGIEEDEPDEDAAAFFDCVLLAAYATSDTLVQHTDFNLNSELLLNRCRAYAFNEGMKATPPWEQLSNFLISSIQSGSPAVKSSVSISSSLPLQLAVAGATQIFHSNSLAHFIEGTRLLYSAHLDGSL